jgi:hypothetical protein
MKQLVGYLQYYETSSTDKPMARGVILGVVIPIVAIIVLLTVCVLRRHRKHKPATDYIPDVLQDYQGQKEDEEIALNHVAVVDVNGYIVDEKGINIRFFFIWILTINIHILFFFP